MNILALETSGDACSCALMVGEALSERHDLASREHTQRLLPMVNALLCDAGLALSALDAIGFGRGPGSFTGVRIAACAAQGLALGADCPVVPISSLRALAQSALERRGWAAVLAGFDARMDEVYLGAYVGDTVGLMQVKLADRVAGPSSIPLPVEGDWRGVGDAFAVHEQALCTRLGARLLDTAPEDRPHAAAVAELAAAELSAGRAVDPSEALPVYLRTNVATPRGGN